MAKVKNRSNGKAVYNIPEVGSLRNVRREFAAHEIKEIPQEELEALTFIGGGDRLLKDYLQILDEEVLDTLNLGKIEPEYNMSEKDIKDLLLTGSLDAFKDCLDFAPQGIKDMIKDFAVSLPLNDSAKREAIKEILHFDVDLAIKHDKESKEDSKSVETTKTRRVETTEPARRVVTQQYTKVDK